MPPPPDIAPEFIDDLLPADSIKAIDQPMFETIEESTNNFDLTGYSMQADEKVIGLVINGEARAYPLSILSNHEIVNDVVGGQPVAVTWCPLCYTAMVFNREVSGWDQPLTFGVSGKLLHNTLVMFDRQTGTLWSQLYGGGVVGALAGESLAIYPSLLTEWDAWVSRYPNSLVLSKAFTCAQFGCGTYADNPRTSYHVDPYASYYNTSWEGVIDRQIPREEESPAVKRRVIGVRVAGEARAYPLDVLQYNNLINDELGGQPLLVWFDPGTQSGTAYLRKVGDVTHTFEFVDGEPGYLRDVETGSQWEASTGQAIAGEKSGERLSNVIVTPAFEFGWISYFPESEVYRIEGR
jgi:hypothetical protein